MYGEMESAAGASQQLQTHRGKANTSTPSKPSNICKPALLGEEKPQIPLLSPEMGMSR